MKITILTISLFLLFSTAVAAQDSDLTLEGGVMEHSGIDAIYKQFSEGYRTLQPELVASLYTEDAAYLSPGGEIRFGRDKVLASFTGFFTSFKKAGRNMTIKFRISQRKVEKNLGYDVGIFILKYYKDGKMLSEHRGKFVTVAVNGEDNRWRFQVDGYSDIKPPKRN